MQVTYHSEKPKNATEVRDLLVSVGWGKSEQYDLSSLQASTEGMSNIFTAYDVASSSEWLACSVMGTQSVGW